MCGSVRPPVLLGASLVQELIDPRLASQVGYLTASLVVLLVIPVGLLFWVSFFLYRQIRKR